MIPNSHFCFSGVAPGLSNGGALYMSFKVSEQGVNKKVAHEARRIRRVVYWLRSSTTEGQAVRVNACAVYI